MEELEGKLVTYYFNHVNVECKGKVIGCDRSIGITIVSDENNADNGNEIMCINGPLSPHYEKNCKLYKLYEEKYEELFDLIVDMIKKGFVDNLKFYDLLNSAPDDVAGDPACAYSS